VKKAAEHLPETLRLQAAEAWVFRWKVELEAELRFGRLARRLAEQSAVPAVIKLAEKASLDEHRHAAYCADLAQSYGAQLTAASSFAPEIAPALLENRDKVLYEVVAACCITETESVSVLTTLVNAAGGRTMRRILRELLRDEVGHSRLGWAHLADESRRRSVGFLGRFVPYMLEGSVVEGLFDAPNPERESPELLAHGILPHSAKRAVFTQTLTEVVFPGLERFGVDTAPARDWLAEKIAAKAS
jgi:hypothetical protein